MISSISIRGFLIHKKFHLDLSPTVTTILGENGSGKSSILKALQWLAFQERGDYATWDTTKVSVRIEIDDHTITRRKSNINSYVLDGTVLERDVTGKIPEEISTILNLSPINFQNQLDKPFWILESAGEVSRQLNSIVNLDVIDRSLARADSEVRAGKRRLDDSQARLDDARARATDLEWVAKFSEQAADVQVASRRHADASERYAGLSALLSEWRARREAQTVLDKVIQSADVVMSAHSAWDVKQKRWDVLDKLISDHTLEDGKQRSAEKDLKEVNKEIKDKFRTCPICGKPMED